MSSNDGATGLARGLPTPRRRGPVPATSAAHAVTTANPPMASLGRCHPAVSVATPMAAAYNAPNTATTSRVRVDATSTAARASDMATVAWPLGKKFLSASSPVNREGPGSPHFMTCVVTFAPTMTVAAASARSGR